MSKLELRIPPVVVVAIVAGSMWLIADLLPSFAIGIQWRGPLAIGCAVAGVAVAWAGVAAFRRARTTVNPTTPEASSTVVTSGIYRWSRNPMYLGFLLMLVGWSLYLSNLAALLLVPSFIVYMNRFQIMPEERALAAKFGAQYVAYMQEVRRWL